MYVRYPFPSSNTPTHSLTHTHLTLFRRLDEEELKDAILLVFANKQDCKGALDKVAISSALGLTEIRNRQWTIQETSALKGLGLFEGFDWLSQSIKGE